MQNLNLFIETYGCQMNVYDSEVVLSILKKEGYELCDRLEDADLILVNTCSIRENAEQRVWPQQCAATEKCLLIIYKKG